MTNPIMARRTVAVMVFDQFDVLDFAAPFEVFSVAGRRDNLDLFDVFTVAPKRGIVCARNNLRILPTASFDECAKADVVVVPGGYGTRVQMKNEAALNWIRQVSSEAEVMLSICSGALILAAAGLLNGRPATTHHQAMTELLAAEPTCTLVHERVVESPGIVTSAGISSGLDASLHVLSCLAGMDVARETAAYIEYDWASAK